MILSWVIITASVLTPSSIISTFKGLDIMKLFQFSTRCFFISESSHLRERERWKKSKLLYLLGGHKHFASWFALLTLGRVVCGLQTMAHSLSLICYSDYIGVALGQQGCARVDYFQEGSRWHFTYLFRVDLEIHPVLIYQT